MTLGFVPTRLGDVLCKSDEWIKLDPQATYSEITVKLWGKGVTLRRRVTGAQVGTDRRLRVRAGQFILSRIDARNGAFGLVPDYLDGAVVSNDFPAFTPRADRLLSDYLGWLSKTPGFVDLCRTASEGTTNRVRLKEDRFLGMTVDLPSLNEQRRIVARVEALAAKVEEARQLRLQAVAETNVLYGVVRDRMYRTFPGERQPIAELFDLINGRAFKPDEWSDHGRRIVRIQNLKYPDLPYNYYPHSVDEKHLVTDGDVLFAWSGQVISLGAHIWRGEEAILNQHIFNVRPRVAMHPRFVQEGFNSLVDEMKDKVRGLEMFHIRKQELNQLMFPVLLLSEQERIVRFLDSLRAQLHDITRHDQQTSVEFDALLLSILNHAFRGDL